MFKKKEFFSYSLLLANLLFIFIFLSQHIFCESECSSCESVDNQNNENHECNIIDCKHSYRNKKYYYCQGISSVSVGKYFLIQTPDNRCEIKESCPDLIISITNECVPSCFEPFYQLGHFCIIPQGEITEQNDFTDNYEIIDYLNRIIKCKHYTKVITDQFNKENHICGESPSTLCPSLYYDKDENRCIEKCENKKIEPVKSNSTQNTIDYYLCKNECELEVDADGKIKKFEYTEINGNTYCLDACPSNSPYFYETYNNQAPICQQSCKDNHFYNSDSNNPNKCTTTCQNDQFYLVEKNQNFFNCTPPQQKGATKACPDSHPYNYRNSCLKSCTHTKSITYSHSYQIEYTDTVDPNTQQTATIKICVDNCYLYDNKLFNDDIDHSCVSKCSDTRNIFYYNHRCLNSCKGINGKDLKYIKTSLEQNNIAESDENGILPEYECVENCPNNYYNYNNEICLKYCPKTSAQSYIDLKTKSCSTCNKDEGFLYYEELISTNQPNNVFCYESCKSDQFYEINSNICYPLDKNIDTCYFSEDNPYICYPSCKDNPEGNYLHEKKVGGKNICMKELNCENKYYFEIGGSTKCVDDKKECIKNQFYYLKDKKCIKECEGYRIKPKETIYDGVTELGKCCDTSDCDSEYIYYSENDKVLNKTCTLKIIEAENGQIGKSTQGNCVLECPADYPFESEDGKKCLLTCPKFYYIKGNAKKCVNDCKSINKFNFEGETECLDNCSKIIKDIENNTIDKLVYYYFDEDNKCHISCKDIDKFSLKAINSPQKCLSECPNYNKSYYENDNICLSSCSNGFYKSNEAENKICVMQCKSDEFVINGNTCINDCDQFIASVPLANSNIIINRCVNNCVDYKFNYFYENKSKNEKRCYENCPPNTYQKGNECVDSCPEGYFTELNICKNKCNSKYYVKSETGDYKCVQNCDLSNYFVSSSKECVKKCGIGENYIGNNRECKASCDKDSDGKYYKFFGTVKENDKELYKIYICMNNYGISSEGNTEYLVYDDKKEINEIVDEVCPNDYYMSTNGNVCYLKCNFDDSLKFSTEEDGKKICSFECKGDYKYYLEKDKVCLPNCDSFLENKIIDDKDNSCVSECDTSSIYKFQTMSDDKKLHCSTECKGSTLKYYYKENVEDNDYKCVDKCLAPDNYVYDYKCFNLCPYDKFAFASDSNEYECIDECTEDKKYYYLKDKKCISKETCTETNKHYIIEGTNICTPDCTLISTEEKEYHFYDFEQEEGIDYQYNENTCVTKCPEDKPFLMSENNHCAKECNQESYKYYKEDDRICLEKCPKEANIIDEKNICRNACPVGKFHDEVKNECIDSCLHSAQMRYYYTPPDNKCIKECNPKEGQKMYINNYACVTSCPGGGIEENIYVGMLNNCVNKCPKNINFVVKDFIYEKDKDRQKICDNKCPSDYPYFIYEKEKDINYCFSTCNFYIVPEMDNFNSMECFEDKDKWPTNYNYYIKYDNNTAQLLKECPDDMPYYNVDEEYEGKNRCYEKCPHDRPYSNYNSFECKESCDGDLKIIDYDTKKCVSECNSSQYWAKDGSTKYCLNKCNSELGEYLSIGGECVKSCDSSKYLVSDITNPLNKTCNCEYLYYVDNSGNIICLDPQQKECGEGEDGSEIINYKYRISNTNQCVKSCFGYLSPSQDICYLNEKCDEIDINTYLIIKEDLLICDCKYKYYINPNTKKKICLSENEECSGSYYMYTPETKECSFNCKAPYSILFDDDKCFKECPLVSEESGNCKCGEFLSKISETKYKCIPNDCEDDSPYKIVETKKCVKKCLGTGYEILHKNECKSTCDEGMKRVEIEDGDKSKDIAKYKCQCETIWYYKDGEIECLTNSEHSKCSEEGFKYTVKETKECVNYCPDTYYYFNDECFKNCAEAKDKFHYPVKNPNTVSDSRECVCENLWKKTEVNNDNTNLIQYEVKCLTDIVCEKLMVHDTNECVEDCPPDYPLEFNNQCYKRGQCPEGTEEDILKGNSCICKKVWHRQDNDNIKCINSDICPDSHPYKIYSTRECISQRCSDTEGTQYILNYTCYEKCPDGTVSNEKSKMCECDPEFGYWYYEDNEKQNMICGLSNCTITGDKLYYKNNTKQCLSSCAKYELYNLDNICYEDECPYPTVSENVLTNKYECTVKKYTTATNLDESYKFIKDEIVELYKSVPKGGIVYHNFQSTMQVYGINKNNNETKDLNLRSSLSYIDVTSCIDKIYENNKMKESDDIVVVKYDLEGQINKSLVNPVEYEFINSRTGQVLDMTVCKKDDIIISYSLSDILNYNFQEEERILEESQSNQNINESDINKIILDIQKQYTKGKEIYHKHKMDTFNINSTLYNDMCFSFEIDGKDLVLEDRVKYLYPHYSLCEANCTYSYTDFELERIFCNCPLKGEFDFKREQKFFINDNNINDIKSKQKGPTNIPVMECMSKLSESKKIRNNGAFFFSLVIMIFEVGLFFLTIFYCYKILKNKICQNNIEEKENEIENNKINSKGGEIVYKTSGRNVGAPPRKREIKNNEINPNDIKLEQKTIKSEANEINNKENDGTETEDPRLDVDDSNNDSFAKEYELGVLNEIKKEEKLLRLKFELAIQRDKSDIFITLLTEVCDKIYLFKVLFLLGKYDMFSIYYSLYLLYHLILFTMITCFYDIKTIQNIWNKDNYPNLNYDLGRGLLASLILWVIYRIFLCIINNDTIINKYMSKSLTKSTNSENDDLRENNKKLNNLITKIRNGMIAYFVIELIAVLLCLLYVTTFSAIYIGTKAKVFRTYGITLAELVIIKILYGIILGIFRKVGLYKKKKVLYKIAYYFDKYIY